MTPFKREPRYCLQCDDGTVLVHEIKDITRTLHDGEILSVAQVSGWHCPVCGEIEFDRGEGKRYSDALDNLRARQAQKLRAQRQALKLTQTEAGNLFDGGGSAFRAYEHGKTQPHKSTVLLLRLLSNHPELLAELR